MGYEVKMAGYQPWTETETKSTNAQETEETKPISSHLDRTGLVNQ